MKKYYGFCNKHETIKSFSAFHWIWTRGLCSSIARIRNHTSDIRLESDVPLNVVVLNFAKTELVKWQLLRNSKSQNAEIFKMSKFSKCRNFQNVSCSNFLLRIFCHPWLKNFFRAGLKVSETDVVVLITVNVDVAVVVAVVDVGAVVVVVVVGV